MSHETETLAATAARIIVESELTDWQLARKKAAAALGWPLHGVSLPTDEDIIREIKTYHALYGGDEWAAQLRAQREFALEVMTEMARFSPVLVGPVAEAWAHAGSHIRILLSADNPKEIEYRLIDLGVEFTPIETKTGAVIYEIEDADWPLRLVINAHSHAKNVKHDVLVLNAVRLAALLG